MERRKFLSAAALLAAAPALAVDLVNSKRTNLQALSESGDWNHIRSLFPLQPNKIYLNNGTMGITPMPVLQTLEQSFKNIAENGNYPAGASPLYDTLAELIGADTSEVTITKNVSEGTNHVCWGVPLKRKDEVILTVHEHVGGAVAWLNRARLEGIVIKTIELGSTAAETLQRIEDAITKKTRVIAVPHIPCTIGQVLPVKEICTLARNKGILSAIDGAHPLGMIQFNVKDIGCDYYYGCIHKWALGPMGVGFLYINKNVLDKTRCTHVAAYSNTAFTMRGEKPDMGTLVDTAHRFTYGSFCGPLWDGALKALEFYKIMGPAKIEERSKGLTTRLQQQLLELGNRIEMLTPTEDISRACQLGFRIKNGNEKASQEFVSKAREKNIILRYVGESNIDCVRVSTHYYNSEADTDAMMDELKKFIG